MTRNFTVYFYIFVSILSVLAMILESDLLLLFARPAIVPSLIIYYVFSQKKYTSKSLICILIIYFISDTIEMLKFQNFTEFTMIIDIIPYLILIGCGINDSKKITFQKSEFVITLLVFFTLMFSLLFVVLSLIPEFSAFEMPIITFGIILSCFVCISLYMYLANPQEYTMYLLLGAVFSLSADIIYVINTMIFYVKGLEYIEFVIYVISLFYMVSYFLKRNENKVNYLKEEIIF